MSSVDSQLLQSVIASIVDCKTAPLFYEKFLSTTSLNGDPKELLVEFFKFCDEYVNGLHQKDGYDSNSIDKAEVSNVSLEALNIIREPSNLNYILDSTLFSFFAFQRYKKSSNLLLKEVGLIDNNSGFKLVKGHKRHHSEESLIITHKNKFSNLENEVNLDDDNPEMDDSVSDPSNLVDGSSNTKQRINPFYIELDQKWTELAKSITNLNKEKPLISLKGERLMVLCKSDDDFRATQNFLDTNAHKYTTLHPRDQRPKKICIRGLPCYTEASLIIQSLKDYGFTVTRAAMMKNRRTGNPMPMYMVNVMPRPNFDEIYNIKEISHILVTIEAFKSHNQVKQCYRCQGFGHASEVCAFTPKCLKCGEKHLTTECHHKGRITPKCANCGQVGHPANFRSCPKHPAQIKKNIEQKSNTVKKINNKPSKDSLDFIEILKEFNYTKKQPESITSENKAPEATDINNSTNITKTPVVDTQSNSTNSSTEILANTPSPLHSSYTNEVSEIFKTFQDIKEMLQITKFLKCIKNIAKLSKTCSNSMDKMLIIINEFDTLANELNIPNHD